MRVETEVKYEGYIKRQLKEARKVEELEEIPIPWDFDYDQAKGVSYAAREQLKRIRPRTLGQASRISTVTPSDLAIIAICLKKEEEASGAV
jgi:tRNA uridine 5-carboxymethylaminomethyl modification enzyme